VQRFDYGCVERPPARAATLGRVEVPLVDRALDDQPAGEAPTAVGEPPVPVISAAVVNALANLTGKFEACSLGTL